MTDRKPRTIDEYIATKPEETQDKLKEIRELIQSAIPHATEAIKWGEPAFTDPDGMILVIFAGYKQHMNLVATPSTIRALANDLSDYKTGKGSIQLPYNKPLPTSLIKKVVVFRANEYKEHGVKWK